MSQTQCHSINPANGECFRSFPEMSLAEVCLIVEEVAESQKKWASVPLQQRLSLVSNLGDRLVQETDLHAREIAMEMGKPIAQARQEVEKCARLCEWSIRAAPKALAPVEVQTSYRSSYYRPEPVGVVLAIMPWNFPYWQVFRAVIPALLAGNGIILKHASNVSGCSFLIEDLFRRTGFTTSIVRSVLLRGSQAAILIAHDAVQGITLTGSNASGEKVAAMAGTQIKKTVIELGGSDPYLVLKDADIAAAARACAMSRMLNAGQVCIAAKRILVDKSIASPFLELFTEEISRFKTGDPVNPDTTMGPLVSAEARTSLHEQVQDAITKGASCLTGGTIPEGQGFYYPPTLLTGVRPGMRVFDEETFGPIACVTTFETEDEAVNLANASIWGLACAVFGQDTDRALSLGERVNSGTCTLNDFVKSDPAMPFGGILKSGYGRELGPHGFLEFTNIRSYNIA